MSQCLLSTRPPILNCVYYMVSPFPAETSQSQFPPPPSFSPLTLNLNLSFSPAGDGVLFCSFFSFLPVHSNFEVIAPFSFVPRLYLSRYVNPSNLSCCHPFFFFRGFTLASTRFHPETSVFCGLYHLRQVPDNHSAPSLCFIFFRGPIFRLLTVFARLFSSPPCNRPDQSVGSPPPHNYR